VACPAETVAAPLGPDSVGTFQAAAGNTIAGLGGGVVADLAGASWRAGDGSWHGLVLGGMDLTTHLRRAGVWGF